MSMTVQFLRKSVIGRLAAIVLAILVVASITFVTSASAASPDETDTTVVASTTTTSTSASEDEAVVDDQSSTSQAPETTQSPPPKKPDPPADEPAQTTLFDVPDDVQDEPNDDSSDNLLNERGDNVVQVLEGEEQNQNNTTMQDTSETSATTEAEQVFSVSVGMSQQGYGPGTQVTVVLSGNLDPTWRLNVFSVNDPGGSGAATPSSQENYGPPLATGQSYTISVPVAATDTSENSLWYVDAEVLDITSNTVGYSRYLVILPDNAPLDSDNDGVPDAEDQCPNVSGPASNNGCPVIVPPVDSDNDGVSDNVDQCLGTPANAPVDANGCADSQKDSDGDGKTDDIDQCPGTQPGFTVDENGCIVCPPGTHPIDAESDGIVNDCEPDVPADVIVPKPTQPGVIDPPGPNNVSYEPQEDTDSVDWVLNPDGSYDANAKPGYIFDDGSKTVHFDAPTDSYDPNTYDQDGDGVVDALDKCADTPAGTPVGINGCPIQVTPVDSDGDGLPDYLDRCPDVAGSTPSGCPPIVVSVPAQPGVIDPPGPNNVQWNVPVSTSVVTWTVLSNGNLRASVTSGDYRFADGSMFVEFCLPADSYVPPTPPTPTAGPTNAVPDYVGTGEGDTGVQSTMHFPVIVALILSLLAGACVVVFRRRVMQ
ncbi:MAG: thrombospondin type 3 repeat-containing protein [Candidatus Saccharimonas sp.]